MNEIIFPLQLLEDVLEQYTVPSKYNILRKAKEEYFLLTGEITNENDLYETKMKMLNDWFIFNYSIKGKTPIELFLAKNKLGPETIEMLSSINYSVFRYLGTNLRKKFVIYDIISQKKIYFSADSSFPSFFKKDLFITRIATFQNDPFLLHGLLMIPSEVYSIIKKQSKVIRKDLSKKNTYLLELERKRTKMVNYKHVPVKSIFQ